MLSLRKGIGVGFVHKQQIHFKNSVKVWSKILCD